MKYFKTHTEFLTEAKRGTILKAAKKGSYPVTVVVISNGSIAKQEIVNTPAAVPAVFNELQKEYPGATINIESMTGETLFVESIITEGNFDKKKLMKVMKKDDGMIQLGNGQEYIIYNPNNGNDDNTDMWDDKVIFALDQDGEEHEIRYSDIVSYNEGRKINLKQDHLSSAEYQMAKKLKAFSKGDWRWNNKTDLYDKVNELRSDMISGTSGRRIESLEDRKYELKKDVKGAQIGNFTNVLLPKGTIIYNLPGGVFADHFSLKNKYASRSSQGPKYFDKPTFAGISVRQMPDILAAIEKNSKVLESFDTEVNEAEFKHINKDEHAIKLAIKDVEKKARLKANRDKPLEYEQLSLNKIMLSKVLGREKLGKEHQAAWKKLKKEYSLKESIVTEDQDTIGGLNKMANTNLERIADYADMIKDRMSQGQTLDAWMYSKISDSVKNLNSVHDTMDGNDGVNEAEDYKYKKYVSKAFDDINDAMFAFRNAMGVKQLGQADKDLKKKLDDMQADIFALQREMKSKGLTESTVNEDTSYKKGQRIDYQLTHKGGVGKFADATSKSKNIESGVIKKRTKGIGGTFKYELTNGLELYGSEILGLTEAMNEGKFDNIDVKDLHFEIDPKVAEEMKIELGKRQGEINIRKQIEGGEYSLRRFRKEIKYDTTGKDLGVFRPGSYMSATSKLGDGPHKKTVKAKRWNQKLYDKWIADIAYDNDGMGQDSSFGFEMAQNAKFEPGLIDWVKKNNRGEDPLQRIQWDIEGAIQ